MSDARKKIKRAWALKFSPDPRPTAAELAELFPTYLEPLLAFNWLEDNALGTVASEYFGVFQRNNQKVDQFVLALFHAPFCGMANPNDVLIRAGWSCIYDLVHRGDDHLTWFREATKDPIHKNADGELIADAYASYVKRGAYWSDPEIIQMDIVDWCWNLAMDVLLDDIEAGLTIDEILSSNNPATIALVHGLELA